MTTQEIEEFLEIEYKKKRSQLAKFPNEVLNYMLKYAEHYDWNIKDKTKIIFYVMKKGIKNLPKCEYEGCNKNVKIYSKGKLTRGCCRDHSMKIQTFEKYGVENVSQLKTTKLKVKKTNMEKYGAESYTSSDDFLKKRETTMMSKYGVTNPMKSTVLKKKFIASFEKKYGVTNPMQLDFVKKKVIKSYIKNFNVSNPMKTEQVRLKTKLTNLEKYGVEYPQQNKEIQLKTKLTNLEKYGVSHNMQTNECKEKRINTWKAKYGVSNPSQNSEILSKIIKSSYFNKEYIWQSGEISIVQGYEPIVLSEFEAQGYKFKDVITDVELMPEIWYKFDGKNRRYFPDFYIPSENLIIEVKSKWTLNLQLEKNQAKFKATKELGFNFRLEVR